MYEKTRSSDDQRSWTLTDRRLPSDRVREAILEFMIGAAVLSIVVVGLVLIAAITYVATRGGTW